MNKKIREILRQMMNPPLMDRKKRLYGGLFAGIPIGFLYMLYLDLPVWLAAVFSLVFVVILLAAFHFEKRSELKDEELKKAIESGEYYEDEKWRMRYEKYCETHDFETVKTQTMKADLNRRYLKKSGLAMITVSLLFFVPAVFLRTGLIETNVFLAVGGLIFLLWGMAKLLNTPVRKFISSCGDELPYIESSYLNGRMLSFKRNGEHSENSGINIGGNYTVLYNKDSIHVIDNKEIFSVGRYVLRKKYYGNGVYTGAYMEYYLSVTLKQRYSGDKVRTYRVQLNEFQAEMAYKALAPYRTSAEYNERIKHDVG